MDVLVLHTVDQLVAKCPESSNLLRIIRLHDILMSRLLFFFFS